jgi:outer membrane protein TolC
MRQDRVAGGARLNALLGREALAPVGALELPADTTPLPSLDTLVGMALQNRAALQAGTERVAAATASLAAARKDVLPDFQFGFAYQHRPAFPDMVSLMVGVTLPIFAGSRQVPARREMAALQQMAGAEQLDLRNETTARVIEVRARAARDRDLMHLYQSDILPQARAAVQSALAGYRVGKVTYMTLTDDQMTVTRYEIETYRLRADFLQAKGELTALIGVQP